MLKGGENQRVPVYVNRCRTLSRMTHLFTFRDLGDVDRSLVDFRRLVVASVSVLYFL